MFPGLRVGLRVHESRYAVIILDRSSSSSMYSAFIGTRAAFLAGGLTLASGDVVGVRNQCFNHVSRVPIYLSLRPSANGYNAEGVPTLI